MIPLFVLLFLLFVVLFISSSIEHINSNLISENNLSNRTPLYGRYYMLPRGKFFLLVESKKVKDDEMVVSEAVESWLKSHYYTDGYNFISTKNGDLISLKVSKVLPKSANLIASDLIIVSPKRFRDIFGVRNFQREMVGIQPKKGLLNYNGGLFISVYIVLSIGFITVLYLKYSQIREEELRENSILMKLGWNRRVLMKLKVVENTILSFGTFSLALFSAYIYTFIFDAPLFSSIFLGSSNLTAKTKFFPYLEFEIISSILLIYLFTFISLVYISLRDQKVS
jgi:hypothetical protein